MLPAASPVRLVGLALVGLWLGSTRLAGATGSQSALTVSVSVVRPCVVGAETAPGDASDAHDPSARNDALIRTARAALETTCAAPAPRIEVLEAHWVELGSNAPVLDIEF